MYDPIGTEEFFGSNLRAGKSSNTTDFNFFLSNAILNSNCFVTNHPKNHNYSKISA